MQRFRYILFDNKFKNEQIFAGQIDFVTNVGNVNCLGYIEHKYATTNVGPSLRNT